MAALLAITLGHAPDCILCGGAAQQLQSQLNLNVRVMDNLVLEGLILIARESMEDAATGAIKLDP
jgi:type III pantothenate kinase